MPNYTMPVAPRRKPRKTVAQNGGLRAQVRGAVRPLKVPHQVIVRVTVHNHAQGTQTGMRRGVAG